MNEILDILTPLQANVTMDERHRYHIRTHDWIPVPSVTQVLDKLPKPFLVPWAGKMQRQVDIDAFWQIVQRGQTWYSREALEAAVLAITGREYAAGTIRDAAGNVGTEGHALIEHFCKTKIGIPSEEPKVSDKAHFLYAGWEEWARSVDLEPLAVEMKVYSVTPGVEYAGTFDLWAKVNGRHTVLDWKFKSYAPGIEAHIQSGAYRAAAMQMGLPEAEGLLVQIPTDGGPIVQHKVDTPLDELFATFLLLRGLHDVLTAWDAKSRKGYRKRRAA